MLRRIRPGAFKDELCPESLHCGVSCGPWRDFLPSHDDQLFLDQFAAIDAVAPLCVYGQKSDAAQFASRRLRACTSCGRLYFSESHHPDSRWPRQYARGKRARPEPICLPVVVLSSSSLPDDKNRAKELGANDYLAKPTGPDDLMTLVKGLDDRWLKED